LSECRTCRFREPGTSRCLIDKCQYERHKTLLWDELYRYYKEILELPNWKIELIRQGKDVKEEILYEWRCPNCEREWWGNPVCRKCVDIVGKTVEKSQLIDWRYKFPKIGFCLKEYQLKKKIKRKPRSWFN
jgi:hypothetical protein